LINQLNEHLLLKIACEMEIRNEYEYNSLFPQLSAGQPKSYFPEVFDKMPRSPISKGRCYLCGKDLGKGAMKTHLNKVHLPVVTGKTLFYLLKVEYYYSKDFWLYLQIKTTATLEDLDSFLRVIWLECCGHLSAFHIHGQDYDVIIDENDEDWNEFFESDVLPMHVTKLRDVLAPDTKFTYDYDFGTPTTLKLTVMDEFKAQNTEESIYLLARNLPPSLNCSVCGEPAVYADAMNMWEEEPHFYCEKCGKKMEKNEEVDLLPITNSPRMGVCAYDGEQDHYGVETVKR
jgi:uncharacterized protein (DUF983 family)